MKRHKCFAFQFASLREQTPRSPRLLRLKPGLHIVVRVAECACDDASKRILKPSTCRLQRFLVRDQYLRSSLPHGDQAIAGQLEKHVLKPMLAILYTTYMETRLKVNAESG